LTKGVLLCQFADFFIFSDRRMSVRFAIQRLRVLVKYPFVKPDHSPDPSPLLQPSVPEVTSQSCATKKNDFS